MKTWPCAAALMLLFAPVLASAQEAKPEFQARSGFWGGLGLTRGWIDVSCDNPGVSRGLCDATDGDAALGGMLRFGWWLNPTVRLGLEFKGHLYSPLPSEVIPGNPPIIGAAPTAYAYGSYLAGYVFPWQHLGLFLKAGIGATALETEGSTWSFTETGLGYLAGAGYEFNIARRWRVVPELSFYGGSVGELPFGTSWRQNVVDLGVSISFD